MQLTTVAEICWESDEEDPNWHRCMARATFAHRDAREFVLHIGSDSYWQRQAAEMRAGGCTAEFVDAYLKAKNASALRVIFYC